MKRRTLLKAATLGSTILRLSPLAAAGRSSREFQLVAKPGRQQLISDAGPATSIWGYNGTNPGPLLRFKRGDRARITLDNQLAEPTTVHWHGLRVPNAMDGVPGLTQPPVAPGEQFVYEFELRNSGTYWYHPHYRSSEQLGRGLYGAIVVEDDEPPTVDRELLWVLDDWRLTGEGQIQEDFGRMHDASHAGRLGNTATINGRVPELVPVQAGERIRLRLLNAANGWIYGLDFKDHRPVVVALDGHATKPYEPTNGMVVIGPAMRVDVIIDMTGKPGERFEITDRFHPRMTYKLADLDYAPKPLREAVEKPVERLSAPHLKDPDLHGTEVFDISFAGGAMGRMTGALLDGKQLGIRELVGAGKAWAVNGVAANGHAMEPLLRLKHGKTYRLRFVNDTAFYHPIHLHGQPFRILSRNGNAEPNRPWRDTVLTAPRETVEVALVADNPGKWMLHCHIPEHQESGMMAVVEVENA